MMNIHAYGSIGTRLPYSQKQCLDANSLNLIHDNRWTYNSLDGQVAAAVNACPDVNTTVCTFQWPIHQAAKNVGLQSLIVLNHQTMTSTLIKI